MKRIIDDIHTFKGNVLGICIEDGRILSRIRKNKDIVYHELERKKKISIFSKGKKVNNKKGKSVRIKKFRKLFKPKSIEYVIINLDDMLDYYKYMASNSIYICKKKIYVYGNSEYVTAKDVAKKFERYTKNVEKIQDGTEYTVIVDCTNTKFKFFKEKFYIVIDTFCNLGDMISCILTS